MVRRQPGKNTNIIFSSPIDSIGNLVSPKKFYDSKHSASFLAAVSFHFKAFSGVVGT